VSSPDNQREFYRRLWAQHGDDPRALGHRDRATQAERFARLARVFGRERRFSVHELGCGLGHFGEYLAAEHSGAEYSGSDLVEEFLEVCRRRHPQGRFHLRDVTAQLPAERYDFVTQSGAFNGRLDAEPAAWQAFIERALRAMYAMARCGIASNFLSRYCDPERMRPELHYQDPAQLTDFVVRELSRHYEIDSGGPLYEFTLRVYRPEYVRRAYGAPEFDRYFASS